MGRAYNEVVIGLVFLTLLDRPATIAEFDNWAVARDVASVENNADLSLKGKFAFLTNTGAFGVGQKGWHARELADPIGNRRFVVFTTALTTQDYGDQVFEWRDGTLTKLVHEKETRGVKLTAADLDIRFNVPEKTTDIWAKISLVATGANDGSFFVRIGDNFRVSAVEDLDGKNVKFGQAGGVLSLPVAKSGEFGYRLHYSGVVNRPRFSGAIVDDEVMLTNDYWWPHIGRLPLALSSTTHVAKDWVVIAQGDKIFEKINGDEKAVRYENKVPVSYMSLSAGKFREKDRVVNGIRYFVASRELTDEQMDDQLEYVPNVIQFFSQLYPHPYKEYGAVDTKLYGGGALEAYSFATYGTGWLPAEDAHEPSHTWWGGIVPNTYLDSFWNESFAVFSEGFYAREGSIGNVYDKQIAFVSPANASAEYLSGTPFSSGAESGGIASAMGYGKGGSVLQQLEFEMGTPAMTEVLKKFLTTHKSGEAGGWTEFENACGSNWKWFFDQWIKRTGWPKLTIGQVEKSGSDAVITMTQEAPFYRFKLEYAVEDEDGWWLGKLDVVPDETGTAVLKIPLFKDWKAISLDPCDRLLQPRRPMEPIRWSEGSRRMKVFDPKNIVEMRNEISALPDELSNVLMVGTPSEIPESAQYWASAGFEFEGNSVTFKGVKVDLSDHAAVAIVEYEPGKFVGLRAGKTKYDPNTGNANAALVDRMGRFLLGRTIPRTNGPLVRRPLE
ncbi:MAG: M1 family metallopeptidase [Fimbriimonadaceae bacterium]